jgi:peptide/nickel transport system substrate-binding protein
LAIEEIPFSNLNTEPIGSGVFAVTETIRNSAGQVTAYRLAPSPYSNQTPRLESIRIAFYPNETALENALTAGDITSTAYLLPPPERIPPKSTTQQIALPRLFMIFFNENRNEALQDSAARQALALAIDREALVSTAVAGHGIPTTQAVFFSTSTLESLYGITDATTSSPTDRARARLEAGGWRPITGSDGWQKTIDGSTVELQVTLKTGNSDLLSAVADHIVRDWQALGVAVTVEQYDQTSLVQSVIRPRDFEGLVYGIDLNRSEDLYPFWHSSQKDDPGLNIAQYTNLQVDELLSAARNEQTSVARQAMLQTASDIIVRETPAIALFQPTFMYLHASDTTLPTITSVSRPADRFTRVVEWHRNQAALWPWFRREL